MTEEWTASDWTEEDQAADNARWAHVRKEERDSMFLSARIGRVSDGSWQDVKVRNLSPGGMMAEVKSSFVRGEAVVVELRGIGEVPGKIAWAAGWRTGVAFDHRINHKLARKAVVASDQPALVQTSYASTWRPGVKPQNVRDR